MPTETFMRLPEDKKNKIRMAAKKEFSRVPMQEASIKNIVQEAEIARGSFYQYFESKEDLLFDIIQTQMEQVNQKIQTSLKATKGDIFKTYLVIYDCVMQGALKKENKELYKRIFENMKAGDDTMALFRNWHQKDKTVEEYYQIFYDLIDKSILKIEDEEDIKIIMHMLQAVTRTAIVSSIQKENKQEERKKFLKQIEYLKYGMRKEKPC